MSWLPENFTIQDLVRDDQLFTPGMRMGGEAATAQGIGKKLHNIPPMGEQQETPLVQKVLNELGAFANNDPRAAIVRDLYGWAKEVVKDNVDAHKALMAALNFDRPAWLGPPAAPDADAHFVENVVKLLADPWRGPIVPSAPRPRVIPLTRQAIEHLPPLAAVKLPLAAEQHPRHEVVIGSRPLGLGANHLGIKIHGIWYEQGSAPGGKLRVSSTPLKPFTTLTSYGTTHHTEDEMTDFAAEWEAQNPNYNLITDANCQGFASAMLKKLGKIPLFVNQATPWATLEHHPPGHNEAPPPPIYESGVAKIYDHPSLRGPAITHGRQSASQRFHRPSTRERPPDLNVRQRMTPISFTPEPAPAPEPAIIMANKKRGTSSMEGESTGGVNIAMQSAEVKMSAGESAGWISKYIATIIAPETTKDLPLLYATGPSTQRMIPEATFQKLEIDWPQTGTLYYPAGHRMAVPAVTNSGNPAGDLTITDQLGQPLQTLHILADEATQAGIFDVKNSPGADATYRWTGPGGTPNFIVNSVPSAGAINTQTPSLFEDIMPISATYDPTVLNDIVTSQFYAGVTVNGVKLVVKNSTTPVHGPVLPVLRANGHNYVHIDACQQVFTNNGGNQLPPVAAYTTAAASGAYNAGVVAAGSTSSCIVIKEGSTDPALVKVFPQLAALATGDQITIVCNAFKNNTDGNPIFEHTFILPTWPPTLPIQPIIAILPIPETDEYRLRISVLTASGGSTGCRSFQIGQTSVGGLLAHQVAPGLGISVLAVAMQSRLWGNGLNVKNWTQLGGRGAIAVIYKMQVGDYWSEAFGVDKGDPYGEMSSQEEEFDETFEKGERFYNTPPCEEDANKLRENLDQGVTKKKSNIPQSFLSSYPYALYYNGVDRNLTAQCLKSPGVQNNVTNVSGGTNVIVNQSQAQNTDATWWTRWEFVGNSKESQVFFKLLPPKNKGLFEIAAGRTALMKKGGPSSADLSFYMKSEGYLSRKVSKCGIGMTY